MERKWLRFTCAALAAVMLMLMAACGTPAGTTTPTDAPAVKQDDQTAKTDQPAQADEPAVTTLEPLVFTVFAGNGSDTFAEDACHKFLKEQIGIDIQNIYTANDVGSQINLMLASEDYPDSIRRKAGEEVNNFVRGGHVLDLTDWYPKYLPRLYAMMQDDPDLFKFKHLAGFDEQIWYVPSQLGIKEYPNIANTIGMRYDLWRKLADNPADLPKPKTTDEFYDLAKAMVELQPEYDGKKCYAFSGWFASGWGGQWDIWALTTFGGSQQWTGAASASDSYQLTYCFDSETWMYAMRFFNRAFREGIADPEAVTMNQEEYNMKLAQGIIYCTPYSGFWLDGVANTARAAAGHPEQKLVPYTWMTYPASVSTDRPLTGGFDPRGIHKTLFTKNCKDAEEKFKRLSWLATDEGAAFQGMGLEGVHWDYDADGFRKPKDEIIQQSMTDPDFDKKTGVGRYVFFGDVFYGLDPKGDAYNLAENKYTLAVKEDDYDREYKSILGLDMNLSIEANAARAWDINPESQWLSYTTGIEGTAEYDRLEDIKNQLNSMENEYIGKLYMAKDDAEFDALVAEWRSKCDNISYKDYYDFYNPFRKAAHEKYLQTVK